MLAEEDSKVVSSVVLAKPLTSAKEVTKPVNVAEGIVIFALASTSSKSFAVIPLSIEAIVKLAFASKLSVSTTDVAFTLLETIFAKPLPITSSADTLETTLFKLVLALASTSAKSFTLNIDVALGIVKLARPVPKS